MGRVENEHEPNKGQIRGSDKATHFDCDALDSDSQVCTPGDAPYPFHSYVQPGFVPRCRETLIWTPRCGPTDVHTDVCPVCLFRWFVSRKAASTPPWLAALPSKCQQVLISAFLSLTGAASSVHIRSSSKASPNSLPFARCSMCSMEKAYARDPPQIGLVHMPWRCHAPVKAWGPAKLGTPSPTMQWTMQRTMQHPFHLDQSRLSYFQCFAAISFPFIFADLVSIAGYT